MPMISSSPWITPSSPPRPCRAMNAKSISRSWANRLSLNRTSMATTLAPRFCRAARTALPLRREISRSADSPPNNTPILPSACNCPFISAPLHFLQLAAGQVCCDGADIAGTLGHQNVAWFQHMTEYAWDLTGVINENGINRTALTDAATQAAALGASDGIFTGGIDFHQQQQVDFGQHTDEIFIQFTGTAVTMRLVQHDNALAGIGSAGCRQGCRHFARVVTI